MTVSLIDQMKTPDDVKKKVRFLMRIDLEDKDARIISKMLQKYRK